jgi:4-hydroxy-tetrahydrodipicolinate synthase
MPSKIQGVLPAAITPRCEGSTAVDFAAGLELLDFLESHHVDGITLFGSTGEFPHFSIEDRTRFVAMAAKRASVPILVNVSHSTFEGAVQLAQEASGAGAAGVLLMPAYYFRYGQDDIRAFFLQFAEQVDLPIYLYNMPFGTTELELQTSLDLLSTGAFAGIKDSGGKWQNFEALQALAVTRGFTVLTGADLLFSRMRRAGIAGTISGFVRGVRSGPNASPLGPEQDRRLADFRSWFSERLPEIVGACQQTPLQLNPH